MKLSFVSSQAISQAMRYQMMRMQADLVKANKEVVTLRVADVGLALGAKTGMSTSLHREIDRLKGLTDTNQLAASRLDSTQIALQDLTKISNDFMAALTTASSGVTDPKIIQEQARTTLSTMTAILNSNLNGEYLFAGVNTDVMPINDFLNTTPPLSENRAAYEAAFAAASFSDPITATEINDFLDSLEVMFSDDPANPAAWQGTWSNATNDRITSRITLTETTQTSVSANITGVRKLTEAVATVAMLAEKNLDGPAREALLERALAAVGEAITDFSNQQGYVGVAQQKINQANDRMSMQIDLFSKTINDLEGIDPYEASTQVSGLMAQIELSYSLTARMQQMSLLKYLS